jgi:exosortase/archaeosortase family protein
VQKKKKALLKFLVIFIGIIAIYYLVIAISGGKFLDSYINLTAYISAGFLSVFTKGAHSELGNIITPNFTIVLSFGCEGSEPIVIFIAGVLAFPSALKSKGFGLLIGVPLLFFMNIFRIVALYYIGINWTSQFDKFHTIIFPVLFILISVIAWVYWIKMFGQKKDGVK